MRREEYTARGNLTRLRIVLDAIRGFVPKDELEETQLTNVCVHLVSLITDLQILMKDYPVKKIHSSKEFYYIATATSKIEEAICLWLKELEQ